MKYGVVVIGRNEGGRLKLCIESLPATADVVYVDSGSTDGSTQWARDRGIEVIDLDLSLPFTAARARNAGFKRLQGMVPELAYVQFLDGDCQLSEGWPQHAIDFIESHPKVGVALGRLRERYPDKSIYNWICDHEWRLPSGEVRYCGGIAMTRVSALEAVGGYREDLIAGEEPELCVRLRARGWQIWMLDSEMALHDAAILHFGQWWRRSIRTGYAYAQGVYLHGAPPERHCLRQSRRAWVWGLWLPLVCLAAGLALGPWGWAVWILYPLQMLRLALRNSGSPSNRLKMALIQVLSRFPEAWGQFRFTCDRLLNRQAGLIEYK